MKKKFIAIALVLTMAAGMAACSAKDEEKLPPVDGDQTEQGKGDAADDSTSDGALEEGKEPNKDQAGGTGNTTGKPGTGTSKPGAGTTKPDSKPQLTGTLEEIMGKIYAGYTFEPQTAITEITAENQEYFLGTKDIKFKRAIASEPLMSSVAHSMVLVEMKGDADIAAAKKAIKENVDGRKWICVGVEPENILVESIGNTIFLVMSEDSKTIMEQFLSLAK